jgi:hypothetical protein
MMRKNTEDNVLQAFDEVQADITDNGFSDAVVSTLATRQRFRRSVLFVATLAGMAIFLQQLNAGWHLMTSSFASFAPFSSAEPWAFSMILSGGGWIEPLVVLMVIAAVMLSTAVVAVQALREEASVIS